jgi:uncharacterized cupin superfamily protein
MGAMTQGPANAFDDDCEYDAEDPSGYRCGMTRVGSSEKGNALAVNVCELPAGESLCPYHYEYEEEWLVVLSGSVVVRTPDGEETLRAGDVLPFAAGPEGAHKVSNAGDEVARVLMFSSAREPAVAVYPDSDKIGVWPGNEADKVMLHRRDGAVPYYEGESA